MITNNKVNRVALNPTDQNLFLALENLNLHIWDAEQKKAPIVTKQLSSRFLEITSAFVLFIVNIILIIYTLFISCNLQLFIICSLKSIVYLNY